MLGYSSNGALPDGTRALSRCTSVKRDLVDILARGFNFGIRSENLVPSDMIAIPLGPARSHAVVAAPACLAERGLPCVPADLAADNCICMRLPSGALLRWPFEAEGRPLMVDVDGPLMLD